MRIAFVVLAAALTGACANPAKFAPAVETLATATKSAQSAMVDIDADSAKAFRGDLMAHAVRHPDRVTFPDALCRVRSPGCPVFVEFEGESHDLTKAQPSLIPRQIAVMAALVEYTQSLELLAVARDQAALDAAGEKVSGAIAKIAAVPSPVSAVGVFAEPIGRAVAWVLGEAQDMAKMSALRKATAEMQTALDEALPTLAQSAEALYVRRVNDARRQFNIDQPHWARGEKTEASLKAYVASAQALDHALANAPTAMFDGLAKAHAALADAVKKGAAPDATLRARITEFAEKAKSAAEIARQFRDAGKAQNP